MRTYEWDAPAKLFFWPAGDGWDEEAVYPTLHDALQAASEGASEAAWIVTRNGDIISPRLIAHLREEIEEAARRRPAPSRSLFGWARAA
ncbi:hypothetical protein [Enterovirga aerilata]|uniref:Uncharacterized protein n=1 Tax=Enterovirga aerilata TaxID=2730920 RepID=A0A849I6W1_9HYPH|nr:hypothetical protein [Enterovirga sp. DB1703]NNM73464.1 hypothetical protein [Enterovirga sp. DB1703]